LFFVDDVSTTAAPAGEKTARPTPTRAAAAHTRRKKTESAGILVLYNTAVQQMANNAGYLR